MKADFSPRLSIWLSSFRGESVSRDGLGGAIVRPPGPPGYTRRFKINHSKQRNLLGDRFSLHGADPDEIGLVLVKNILQPDAPNSCKHVFHSDAKKFGLEVSCVGRNMKAHAQRVS